MLKMRLKTKRKIRKVIAIFLGIAIFFLTLLLAYWKGKLIETCIMIVLFYIYRYLFEKQWHAASIYVCAFVTLITLIVIINIEMSFALSIVSSAVLTFIITLISYYIRDYLDDKILIETYRRKLNSFKNKALENLTEEEMVQFMPKIRYDILHIVYEYLHRDKTTLTASGFAYRNNISEATLYRYLKQVKDKYESLGLNS